MLIIRMTMMQGRSDDQKRALIERLSAAAGKRLGVPLEDVRMTIVEVPATNWGVAGKPMADRQKAEAGKVSGDERR